MKKIGRPTLFSSEIIIKSEEYLSLFSIDHSLPNNQYQTEILPSLSGLAEFLEVSRATIYNWKKTILDFLDILEKIKYMQEAILLSNGLKGLFNPTMTKIMLTKHDYGYRQSHRNRNQN